MCEELERGVRSEISARALGPSQRDQPQDFGYLTFERPRVASSKSKVHKVHVVLHRGDGVPEGQSLRREAKRPHITP